MTKDEGRRTKDEGRKIDRRSSFVLRLSSVLVARFTLLEVRRRRLLLAVLVLSLLFIALFAVGFAFLHARAAESFVRPGRSGPDPVVIFAALMTLMGLYVVNFLGGILAIIMGIGTVSAEVDSGTFHALLSKPIRRRDVLLGKWLAYAGMLGLYLVVLGGALLAAGYAIAGYLPPQPLPALGLMVWSAWVVLTLAVLGSTFLPTLANGVVVFMLFGVAYLGGVVEVIGSALQSQAMVNLGVVVSLLMPTDVLWRSASYYLQPAAMLLAQSASPNTAVPFISATPPSGAMLLWAALHVLAAITAAILVFDRRDL